MPYLDQSKIALPKDETNYNTWADYIELFCLLHPDRNLSVETILDRLIDENDGDADKALSQIRGAANQINTILVDKIADDQIDTSFNDPETEQKIKNAILTIVQYIKKRKSLIPEHYPFAVNPHNQLSAIQSDSLTSNHKLYIILLLSSLIRVIQRKEGFTYRITHRFEELCRAPFSQLVPSGANLVFFGAGGYISDAESGAVINGSFYSKIVQLSKLLKVPTTKLFTPENAGVNNNGDGGLDWLAYFPFDDDLSTTPTVFAQCACGNDWEEKMFDTHMDKWRNYITWLNDYSKIHFIPKSFRDENNAWLNEISIFNCTLVDRFRLIGLIQRSGNIEPVIDIYTDILEEVENTQIDFNS